MPLHDDGTPRTHTNKGPEYQDRRIGKISMWVAAFLVIAGTLILRFCS